MERPVVSRLLEQWAETDPTRIALRWRDHAYSYAHLDAVATSFSERLRRRSLTRGDRVVLLGDNHPMFVAALFGVAKAGGIFVPLHPSTSRDRLAYVLRDCDPAVIVLDSDLWATHSTVLQEFSGLVCALDSGTGLVDPWPAFMNLRESSGSGVSYLSDSYHGEPRIALNDIAAIIYTSGSTKDPKGVIAPHTQILFATSAINTVLRNSKDDVILCGIPLSFDYGLYQVFLSFMSGACLILDSEFSNPLMIPRLLKHHQVTGFPGVPSLFAMLLRSHLLERVDLPSLRYVTSTGDVFPPVHIKQLRALFPRTHVIPMYGLTECKRVSIMPPDKFAAHPRSVGLPLPGTHVKIVDEHGKPLPLGAVGELIVTGPHVMAGYWGDAELTATRFRVSPETGEIWLHTGDSFQMDEEGFLYFIGRDQMMIKSRGERVSAAEIEAFLCEIKGVTEACAVGLPDPVLGQSVCVYVVQDDTASISPDEIDNLCRTGLSKAARPKYIDVRRSPLPRTPNGKTDRARLLTMAANIYLSAEDPPPM